MASFHIPAHEYTLSFAKSGGPGGQNVNKANTKATLQWNVMKTESLPPEVLARFLKKYANKISSEGVLTLTSQTHRTQHLNLEAVVKKLHAMIESAATPPKVRKATKPTKASKEERLKTKKSRADTKKLRREKFF